MDPDKVVSIVKDSELRGRGGAGFPCGLKWSFLPKDRKETFMCVNGDESEPATFNNRILIEKDPHQFIEGILIACFATKASTAYVYLRFEYINAYRILEAAIAEARAAGHLGKNIYGSGFDLEIYAAPRRRGVHLRRGDRADREPRGEARAGRGSSRRSRRSRGRSASRRSSTTSRPSAASRTSSSGAPTGSSRSARPRATARSSTCVSGHVNKQVCVELPLGVTCRELIDVHAGGVWKGRKAKAAVPGGISMGLLSADELDTPLDFESLRKPGCLGLGTAAVTVIDDQTSIVDYLYNTCRFFAHESCGQCTPCREGTGWMYKMIKRIRAGGGRIEDLDIMLQHGQQHGHHPGHHDLRPGRRRRLADQERASPSSAASSRSTSGSTSPRRTR